jgi:hypothetical protein
MHILVLKGGDYLVDIVTLRYRARGTPQGALTAIYAWNRIYQRKLVVIVNGLNSLADFDALTAQYAFAVVSCYRWIIGIDWDPASDLYGPGCRYIVLLGEPALSSGSYSGVLTAT